MEDTISVSLTDSPNSQSYASSNASSIAEPPFGDSDILSSSSNTPLTPLSLLESHGTLPSPLSPSVSDTICQECRKLDLQKAASLNTADLRGKWNGVFIAKVGQRYKSSRHSDCDLCRLLSTAIVDFRANIKAAGRSRKGHRSKRDEYALRAFGFLPQFPGIKQYDATGSEYQNRFDSVSLLIVRPGFDYNDYRHELQQKVMNEGQVICFSRSREKPEAFAPDTVPRYFNPSLATKWIQYCKSHHTSLCETSGKDVADLKLIDCHHLNVVSAPPSATYVALSYVWGRSPMDKEPTCIPNSADRFTLPKSIPLVIADAIQVTTALKYRYLWVDKYCIDQQDYDKKHHQIQQMDGIYQNAEFTIIGAGGDDEDCGLPGIGSTPRVPQLSAAVGDISILSTLPHPHHSIRSSKWSTRGWTYQEAVLSRRRLVFLKDQMYFECEGMNCCESISSSLDVLHTEDKSRFRDFMRAGTFGRKGAHIFGQFGFEKLSTAATFVRYTTFVEEYSDRELTYPRDSLNAFTGIIKHFEPKSWLLHLWGTPFVHPAAVGNNELEYRRFLANGLAWRHKHSCWEKESEPRRRHLFPSWSWAGWGGTIEYRDRAHDRHQDNAHERMVISDPAISDISLELPSGRLVEPGDLYPNNLLSDWRYDNPKVLRFLAGVIPPHALTFHEDNWTVFGCRARVSLSEGPSTPREVLEGLKTEQWRCAFIGSDYFTVFIIITGRHGGSEYRAGLITSTGWTVLEKCKELEMQEFRLE